MNTVTTDKDAATKAHIDAASLGTVQASQLQNMVKLYERIQQHVFRLMATDSVPKFCKTERVGAKFPYYSPFSQRTVAVVVAVLVGVYLETQTDVLASLAVPQPHAIRLRLE